VPTNTVHRLLVASIEGGAPAIRTAKYAKRDHLVVPVIMAIGDSVIRPLHSEGPELVPARELQVAASQWNGRPVVLDHPSDGLDSANYPSILDSLKYGEIFDARYEDGKLKANAYLDPVRASEIGGQWILDDLAAGRMVEVSVGAWVTLVRNSGLSPLNGAQYEAEWHHIISDHLAVGLNGKRGACSVDMGCGALRLNSSGKESPTMPFLPRVMEALRSAFPGVEPEVKDAVSGQSDVDLRNQLGKALHASEPGFAWVEEVFAKRGGGTVVYSAMPEDRMIYFQRTYTLANGEVSMNDDRSEVRPETEWRTVAAVQTVEGDVQTTNKIEVTTEARGAGDGCKCHTQPTNPPASNPGDGEATEKETVMAVSDTVKALVGRIVACTASPYAETDRATLEAWPEPALTDLATRFEAIAAKEAAPAPVVAEKKDEAKVKSAAEQEAEWLANAPPAIRTIFSRAQAADAQHRAKLVETIVARQATKVFTAENLNTKSTDDLELIASALSPTPVSYEGRGVQVAAAAGGGGAEYPKAPSIYDPPSANTGASGEKAN
jgi:hypothetical protein